MALSCVNVRVLVAAERIIPSVSDTDRRHSMQIEAALAGLGVASAPRLYIEAELAKGRLVAPWPDGDSISKTLPLSAVRSTSLRLGSSRKRERQIQRFDGGSFGFSEVGFVGRICGRCCRSRRQPLSSSEFVRRPPHSGGGPTSCRWGLAVDDQLSRKGSA